MANYTEPKETSMEVLKEQDSQEISDAHNDYSQDAGIDPHREQNTSTYCPSQIYQVFEPSFSSPMEASHGVLQLYSTGTSFSINVGESRWKMGIKGDSYKMTNGHENNYFKDIRWSPDGTCLLSSSNDNCLRIFALPTQEDPSFQVPQLEAGLTIREGEAIYDMCWYPGMTSTDLSTCCVLSSSRDHPVHLWDAYTGALRCSYTLQDHCEVNIAPTALCFNPDGTKIYCGSNNMIQIFDTTRPGKDCQRRPTVPTRKSRKGQKGVISTIAFNPDGSNIYATGSYLKTVGLYDATNDELLMLLRDNISRSSNTTSMSRQMGGVTQVKFSPDGVYLYSASRQDPLIRCWDIRNTAQVLATVERPGETTNQRIRFDLSSNGRWLVTGDMNGDLSIFDLLNMSESTTSDGLVTRVHCHEDIVSAAVFHPNDSRLATSSGQRKYDLGPLLFDSDFGEPDKLSELEDSIVDDLGPKAAKQAGTDLVQEQEATSLTVTLENSIRIWSLPGQYVWYVNDDQQWKQTTGSVPE